MPTSLRDFRLAAIIIGACIAASPARANPPVSKYIFPAGGQRGTTVNVRVGGCFFHNEAGFDMPGHGIEASPRIREIDTIWFEGPQIPQPASQQAEDYPKDHAGVIKIKPDALLGPRPWRIWTAQGATTDMKFIIGDLPEIVEQETDGAPIPVKVDFPVTINGRIFPREDVDLWTFTCKAGQQITCDVTARRFGSPLDAELKVLDPAGKPVRTRLIRIEGDPRIHFTAGTDGLYSVRIHDIANGGLQHYIYRLTITSDPQIDAVFPLGARRGSKTRFELFGHALQADSADADIPTDAPDAFKLQLSQAGKKANAILIDLDDLPELLESEPNDVASDVKPIAIPAMLNGRIGKSGDVDYWKIEMKKDESVDLDLRAARLGSPLDSVVSIEDSTGKQLARNDDISAGQTDSILSFKAPADGIYSIRITDRFPSRGGPAFAYRLRVAPPKKGPGLISPDISPDFRLTLAADVLSLARTPPAPPTPPAPAATAPDKKPAAAPPPPSVGLKIDVQRIGGFDGPINLTIDGLPPSITATGTTIPAKQSTTEIKFTADPTTKIAGVKLRIRGTADIAGKSIERTASVPFVRAMPDIEDVLLAITIPTPFKATGEFEQRFAPVGTIYRRRYKLDRGGFDGPITVRLADQQARHLQGVTAPTITIPAGADSFEYSVSLPPDLELGRTSRSCLMLIGAIKDADGTENIVSFSSTQPNDQYIAIATAPELSLRVDQTSLLVHPGRTEDLLVHAQRAPSLANQPAIVDLLLPPHIHDVKADPITIPPGQADGTLRIRLGPKPGPFNMPITIRILTPGPKDPTQSFGQIELVLPPDSSETKPPPTPSNDKAKPTSGTGGIGETRNTGAIAPPADSKKSTSAS